MKRRYFCFALSLSLQLVRAQGPSPGPSASSKPVKQTRTQPRTADGHPDLQGFWSNNIATPLERPKELAGRAALTDDEVAAMKKKAHELFGGNGDAAFGDAVFQVVWANVNGTRTGFISTDGETGDYSSVWTVEREWDNRTSLITDPPDGRIPTLTPEGQKRRDAMREVRRERPAGPEDRSLAERCLSYGSPQLFAGYQAYYQIVQTPKSVMFMTEMIHDVRSIPIDGGPHLPSALQRWMGDSRGHWEGDTLIVDTTNYKPRAFQAISSEKLHVTERLSLRDAETLKYEVTIDDPGTWTRPWSLMVPLRRTTDRVFEYACHEGNEGLAGILAGARAEETAEAKKSPEK
jgi:hypothetical protein